MHTSLCRNVPTYLDFPAGAYLEHGQSKDNFLPKLGSESSWFEKSILKYCLLHSFPSSLIISHCTVRKSKLVVEEVKDVRVEERELSLLLLVIWVGLAWRWGCLETGNFLTACSQPFENSVVSLYKIL